MTIGIIGLGLIGGSLAQSIRRHTGHTVLGRDTDPATMLPPWRWTPSTTS